MNNIPYAFNCHDKNSFVYSCDMIRIKFVLAAGDGLLKWRYLDEVAAHFSDPNRIDIKMFRPCFTDFKFKNLFNIMTTNCVVTLGLCFNGYESADRRRGFIEFNPNKLFNDPEYSVILHDLCFLRERSSEWEISRWDLAVDMPIPREFVRLVKGDRRNYSMKQVSHSNFTEYLGKHGHAGFVKLYNKQIESDLPYECTRFEITLDSVEYAKISDTLKLSIPRIYYRTSQKELLLYDDLDSTDKVLLELILDSEYPTYYLSKLCQRRRGKLRPFVEAPEAEIGIDKISAIKVCDWASDFVETLFYEPPADEDGFHFPNYEDLQTAKKLFG